MRSFRQLITICIVLCVLCLAGTAAAQIPDRITGMTLETDSLTMEIGDTYRFKPEFSTEGNSGRFNQILHVFSSDENVVKASAKLNTIEAVAGGNAKVYLYTEGYKFSAECNVTVKGASKAVSAKGAWKNPTAAQLEKITDPSLKAFFELLGKPEMAKAASALSQRDKFFTRISVTAGRAESLAGAMRELGMDPVYAFSDIDTIAAQGNADQYMVLLRSENVLSIDEDTIFYLQQSADDMFSGRAEDISHFKAAHDAGLTGQGAAIAILDAGFNRNHEQFTDKGFLYEACFSTGLLDTWTEDEEYTEFRQYIPVCVGDNTEENPSSAEIDQDLIAESIPDYFEDSYLFNHGTTVAAIAAGKDGVAPNADIIAVNIGSLYTYGYCEDMEDEDTCDYYEGGFIAFWHDFERGLQFVDSLMDQNPDLNLATVNLSLTSGTSKSACSKTNLEVQIANLLNEHNVLTVAAAGNDGQDGIIGYPACAPSALSVGALWDSDDPEVAPYSNHSALVDILAPGTAIVTAGTEDDTSYETIAYFGSSEWDYLYREGTGTSMAAPMVSGSIALLRGKYPEWSSAQIRDMLLNMSGITAERKKVKKPVLDLANLPSIMKFMTNKPENYIDSDMEFTYGPLSTVIWGGPKKLQLNFRQFPFNTNYTIHVDEMSSDGSTVIKEDAVKAKSGKNLKTISITGLKNDTLYRVWVDVSMVIGKNTYHIDNSDDPANPYSFGPYYGMPMTAPKFAEIDPIPVDEYSLELKFDMTSNEPDDYDYIACVFEEGEESYRIAEGETGYSFSGTYNRPYTAELYKIRRMTGIPGTYEVTLYSAPVTKDTLMLRTTNESIDLKAYAAYGKLWIHLSDPEPFITAREIEVWQFLGDGGDYNNARQIGKTLKADVKKFPNDILIGGVPASDFFGDNDVTLGIRIRSVGSYNKKSYTEDTAKYGWYAVDNFVDSYLDLSTVPQSYQNSPIDDNWISNAGISAGDGEAVVSYGKNLLVDGYRFEIKPVEPNQKKIVEEVPIAKAQGSYTFKKLTNGTVYKLRMQETLKKGKLTFHTTYYPETGSYSENGYSPYDNPPMEDTMWEGMLFVPLAAPDIIENGAFDYDGYESGIYFRRDDSADGLTVISIGTTTSVNYDWDEGSFDYDYPDDTKGFLGLEYGNYAFMLYKNYTTEDKGTRTFYGPAVFINMPDPIGSDFLDTGEKAAEITDLSAIPGLADAAQVDGKVFNESAQARSKSASGNSELQLLDIFAVGDGEAIVVEDEAEIEEKEAGGDEFESYPEIILEDFEDSGIPAEVSAVIEAEDPEMNEAEETEEDEFESYPEIISSEEDTEEEPVVTEEESVLTPAAPEKKEQKNGFSLFHF